MKSRKRLFRVIYLTLIVTVLLLMAACANEAPAPAPSPAPAPAPSPAPAPAPAPSPAPAPPPAPAPSPVPAPAPSETFNLKVVSGLPAGHAGNRDLTYWAKALEERTGGRVTSELFEGTLGGPPEFYDMIKGGVIDVMSMGDAWAPGQFPVYAVNMLPFEYPNWTILASVLDELYYMGYFPGMEPFKLLYLKPTVIMYPFFTDKKVTKLEDFAGMVMRPPGGPIFTATVEALGATSKSLPGSETYMALSTGQVDGAITGVDNVIGRKFYEVCKYGIKDAPVFGGSFFMIMNLDTWNSLPPDIQLIIEQLDRETYYYFLRGQQEEEAGYWAQTEAEGVELYTIGAAELARWKKACEGIAENWAADVDAAGMPGSDVLASARAIIARYTQ